MTTPSAVGPSRAVRTRVKVCCIASILEAQMAINAGADALGLVARMPSGPGTISDAEIAAIANFAPPTVSTVLLTSALTAEAISAHVRAVGPTAVQIVSPIEVEQAQRLALLEPAVKRIQVVHVEDRQALAHIASFAPFIDAFLLDSGRPSATIPELGGTGRVHDWAISARFVQESPRPVFLAGGLNAHNAQDAVRRVTPFGLDLCSGVRTEGRLDPDKLRAFMRAVGSADAEAAAVKRASD